MVIRLLQEHIPKARITKKFIIAGRTCPVYQAEYMDIYRLTPKKLIKALERLTIEI